MDRSPRLRRRLLGRSQGGPGLGRQDPKRLSVEPPVPPGGTVQPGERTWLLARVGPLTIREPVEVVAVVDEPDRRGFAYATLEGHPVSGEEAFVVHRDQDGTVWLTLRSLTAAGRGWWRLAFPTALVAQRRYRRRYQRALLTG